MKKIVNKLPVDSSGWGVVCGESREGETIGD